MDSGRQDRLVRLQPPSDRVPEAKREIVVRHLTEYALAWGAWRRDELSPPDFLEAQHSLLTNLALDLAEGVNDRMSYPELIKALRVPERWEQDCLDLGRDRRHAPVGAHAALGGSRGAAAPSADVQPVGRAASLHSLLGIHRATELRRYSEK
jgi:hypothetical protein